MMPRSIAAGSGHGSAAGGKRLSRGAMYRVLESAQLSPAGQRGIHILSRLAQEGLICFGPRDGKQQTFTLLEEWIPTAATKPAMRHWPSWPGATSQAMGRRRCAISSGGPGWRLPKPDTDLKRPGRIWCRNSSTRQAYWLAAALPSGSQATQPCICCRLDEYLVGYRDRSAILDPAYARQTNAGGGMLSDNSRRRTGYRHLESLSEEEIGSRHAGLFTEPNLRRRRLSPQPPAVCGVSWAVLRQVQTPSLNPPPGYLASQPEGSSFLIAGWIRTAHRIGDGQPAGVIAADIAVARPSTWLLPARRASRTRPSRRRDGAAPVRCSAGSDGEPPPAGRMCHPLPISHEDDFVARMEMKSRAQSIGRNAPAGRHGVRHQPHNAGRRSV